MQAPDGQDLPVARAPPPVQQPVPQAAPPPVSSLPVAAPAQMNYQQHLAAPLPPLQVPHGMQQVPQGMPFGPPMVVEENWRIRALRAEETEEAPSFAIQGLMCKAKAVGEPLVVGPFSHPPIHLWCFNDVFDAAYASVKPDIFYAAYYAQALVKPQAPRAPDVPDVPPPVDGQPRVDQDGSDASMARQPQNVLKASIQKYAKRLRQKVGITAFVHQVTHKLRALLLRPSWLYAPDPDLCLSRFE